MTRLISDDVIPVSENLDKYEAGVRRVTGCSLREIALLSAGSPSLGDAFGQIDEVIKTTHVAVVPIDTGDGIIPGFSEACCTIALHLGFPSFVTRKTDVSGIAEAAEKGSDVILMADDDAFIAYNPKLGTVIRNRASTAWGFVTMLDKMCGGVAGKDALVLGIGPVGRSAVKKLAGMGAAVGIYDVQLEKSLEYLNICRSSHSAEVNIEKNLKGALETYTLILDATPAAGIIHEKEVRENMYVVSPGVPAGVTTAAQNKLADRFFHDKLELGTAVMLMRSVLDIFSRR